MLILFILTLIAIPIILAAVTINHDDGFFGLLFGVVISSILFFVVFMSTSEIKSTEQLNSNLYTVETTPTRQFIYIKSKDGSAAQTLEFSDVKTYNLINSGNFIINKNSWGNFVFKHYKDEYKVYEKENEIKKAAKVPLACRAAK